MITTYLTDLIDIIQVDYDDFGVSTETLIATSLKARVEDQNVLVNDSEGKEVNSSMLVILQPRDIQPQWKIRVISKNGRVYYQSAKKYEILAFEQSNMMGKETHIEIRI